MAQVCIMLGGDRKEVERRRRMWNPKINISNDQKHYELAKTVLVCNNYWISWLVTYLKFYFICIDDLPIHMLYTTCISCVPRGQNWGYSGCELACGLWGWASLSSHSGEFIFVNVIQVRVIWKEETSTEKNAFIRLASRQDGRSFS